MHLHSQQAVDTLSFNKISNFNMHIIDYIQDNLNIDIKN